MIIFGNTQNKLSYNPPSVVIGTQTWALQNFSESTLIDGTVLTNVTNNSAWAALTSAAWCNYNNDPAIGAVYGKLYNWYCCALIDAAYNPFGWRVATRTDFSTLITYLGGANVAGGKMKESGTTHWNTPNTGADNSSGYTGLGGGRRNNIAIFEVIGQYTIFWTSTLSLNQGVCKYLVYNNSALGETPQVKTYGNQIRLIKI